MSTEFASASLTAGQPNAIVKKLGGHDMALRFLRDELSVSEPIRSWREEDGIIYFSVTSDGTTGEDWIKRLEGNGFRVGDYAKQVLRSPDFKPTNGVTTEVAVLKGMLFEDNNRITKKIRAEADKRKLSKPNAELACLIREKFTDKEIEAMGLIWIVAMHEPINDSGCDPLLLNAYRVDDGRWLYAYYGRPDSRWDRDNGFAFAVSQLSSFLSGFHWRVLFGELPIPSAEHFTGLVQFYGERDIFFVVKRFDKWGQPLFFFSTNGVSYYSFLGIGKIEGADPANFKALNRYYTVDKNHVYKGTKIISNNPDLFVSLQLQDLLNRKHIMRRMA